MCSSVSDLTLDILDFVCACRLWVCSGELFPADLLEKFFEVFTNGQVSFLTLN